MKNSFPLIFSSFLFASSFANGATLAGLWEFKDSANIGKATVGQDLTVVGAAPTHSTTLSDGTTTLSGVITTVTGTANYLRATPGIASNGGGGNYVNEWSILFDVLSPSASRSSWRSLFQTNMGNSNDADYFIRNSDDRLGVSALGYSTNPMNDSQWTRIVVTFNLGSAASDEVKTYINGTLFYTHNKQALNGTYALDPSLLLFADNNAENASLNIGTVALYDGALTASEVATLGNVLTSVPEPSGAMIAVLGLAASVARRSRRRSA